MRITKYFYITCIAFLSAFNSGLTQERLIVFQGYLSNENNIPVTGLRNMQFEVYEQIVGGTFLWQGIYDSIEVVSGVFSVELGDETTQWTELKFDRPYWVSVRVAGNLLPKRIKLSYVPYSLSATAVYGETNVFPGDGNVGINTLNPVFPLDIVGNIRSTGFRLGDDIIFAMNAPNAYLIGGNFGIGTSNPGVMLDVNGNARINGRLEIQSTDFQLGTASPHDIIDDIPPDKYNQRALVHSPQNNIKDLLNLNFNGDFEGGVVVHGDGYTPNLYISAATNGRVGIGTFSPDEQLHVVGNVKANNIMIPLQQIENVENIFPNIVVEGKNGEKYVSFAELIPIVLSTIIGQKEEIEQKANLNSSLTAKVANLEERIRKLEEMIVRN